MTYNEVVGFLEKIGQYTEGTGVSRGRKLFKRLGNPEKNLKIIHVAGTNGKGSVCAFLSQILIESGYKVGLFTSPHLTDIRERIRINREMISKEDFAEGMERILSLYRKELDEGVQPLAYFDYFFGVAMDYFNRAGVDFVVMETGLGGRLDATNSIENPVISIITTISLEHTALLGDTTEKIAEEKAGIIKSKVPVVFYSEPETDAVFVNAAKEAGSHAIPVSCNDYEIVKNSGSHIDFLVHNRYYLNDCFRIRSCGVYQVQNASLALTAAKVLMEADMIKTDIDKLKEACLNMYWPGRMEQTAPRIYLDGAHNPQGIKAFVQSVESMYEDGDMKPATLIFSVVSDKNYSCMISTLCGCVHFKEFLVTVTGGSRFLSWQIISEEFKKNTDRPVHTFDTIEEAFMYARSKRIGQEPIFVTGSLYLVSDLKRGLNEKENDI